MELREGIYDYPSTGRPPSIWATGAAIAIGESGPHHQHGAMNPDSPHDWRPLNLGRDARLLGSDGRPVQRLVGSGQAVRLRRGVAVDATGWDTVSDRDRYFLRMRAVGATRKSQPVYSHQSAAVLWGLPIIGRWPDEVHLMAAGKTGVHSKNGVTWHHDRLPDGDVVEIDGMLVTSLLRTLIDIARTVGFLSAVAALDQGTKPQFILPNGRAAFGIDRDILLDRLDSDGPTRGARTARIAIAFCDNRSGSVGESLSRGQIHLCGFPPPELQVSFVHEDRQEDITDFRWVQKQETRTHRLLGEFDGKVKYTRDAFMSGRTIEEVVWSEKLREDRLRGTGHGMARWIWSVALRRESLLRLLLAAGLRPEPGKRPVGGVNVAVRAQNRR